MYIRAYLPAIFLPKKLKDETQDEHEIAAWMVELENVQPFLNFDIHISNGVITTNGWWENQSVVKYKKKVGVVYLKFALFELSPLSKYEISREQL